MNLSNPFPQRVRLLYLYRYDCDICGRNGQSRGGLAIHHIFGRVSGSALNSSLLCGVCHGHMGHNREEQAMLLRKTLIFLAKSHYETTEEDQKFWESIKEYHNVFNTNGQNPEQKE